MTIYKSVCKLVVNLLGENRSDTIGGQLFHEIEYIPGFSILPGAMRAGKGIYDIFTNVALYSRASSHSDNSASFEDTSYIYVDGVVQGIRNLVRGLIESVPVAGNAVVHWSDAESHISSLKVCWTHYAKEGEPLSKGSKEAIDEVCKHVLTGWGSEKPL